MPQFSAHLFSLPQKRNLIEILFFFLLFYFLGGRGSSFPLPLRKVTPNQATLPGDCPVFSVLPLGRSPSLFLYFRRRYTASRKDWRRTKAALIEFVSSQCEEGLLNRAAFVLRTRVQRCVVWGQPSLQRKREKRCKTKYKKLNNKSRLFYLSPDMWDGDRPRLFSFFPSSLSLFLFRRGGTSYYTTTILPLIISRNTHAINIVRDVAQKLAKDRFVIRFLWLLLFD